jgi:hypothetical protein
VPWVPVAPRAPAPVNGIPLGANKAPCASLTIYVDSALVPNLIDENET